MDSALPILAKPRFRPSVQAKVGPSGAEIAIGETRCSFSFAAPHAAGVARLIADLEDGGRDIADLSARAPEIADRLPDLLVEFDRLRLLIESEPAPTEARTGAQLYREVRRIADRTARRTARSSFLAALTEGRAGREQLIGYALEYFWIVKAAPGLIGPILASAHRAEESRMLQSFLKSELGHDAFLGKALAAAGVTRDEMERHQPLPSTFALGASLGVYARQHPLSFKASLFLFERGQPAFLDAFDARCRALGLPDGFHRPLRAHAELNDDYDHEDISRDLLALEEVVDAEACTVVKRHVALFVETMVWQEEEILAFYGADRPSIPRIFG